MKGKNVFSFRVPELTPKPVGLLPHPDVLANAVAMACPVTSPAVPPVRNGINVTFFRIGPTDRLKYGSYIGTY